MPRSITDAIQEAFQHRKPSTFYRAVIKPMIPLWKARVRALGGVTPMGGEGDDKPPMNPGGGLSLMSPKAYIGLPTPM